MLILPRKPNRATRRRMTQRRWRALPAAALAVAAAGAASMAAPVKAETTRIWRPPKPAIILSNHQIKRPDMGFLFTPAPIPPPVAAAGITLVGITSSVIPGPGNVDLSVPSGVQENDLLIVAWALDVGNVTQDLDGDVFSNRVGPSISGWSEGSGLDDFAGAVSYTNTADMSGGIFYRFAPSSPPASYNFIEGSNVASPSDAPIMMLAFRGVNTTTPFDANATWASASTGDPNSPSITTVTNGAAVISVGALDDDIITAPTPPSGYGDTAFQTGGTSGSGCSLMAAWVIKATAGAENPAAWNTSGDDLWAAATMALRPA